MLILQVYGKQSYYQFPLQNTSSAWKEHLTSGFPRNNGIRLKPSTRTLKKLGIDKGKAWEYVKLEKTTGE